MPDILIVEWLNADDQPRIDYFCSLDAIAMFRNTDVSYVHIWDNPRQGLLQFLVSLPLKSVRIHTLELKER